MINHEERTHANSTGTANGNTCRVLCIATRDRCRSTGIRAAVGAESQCSRSRSRHAQNCQTRSCATQCFVRGHNDRLANRKRARAKQDDLIRWARRQRRVNSGRRARGRQRRIDRRTQRRTSGNSRIPHNPTVCGDYFSKGCIRPEHH